MKNKIQPYRTMNSIMEDIENNNYYKANPETGFLKVTVHNKLNNDPIKDALVRISKVTITGLYNENAEGNLIVQYRTDEQGNIPIIRLQAYNELSSENNFYIIAIHADGYYNAYVFNVQIFPNTTTSYDINLSNRSTGEEKFNFIIQPFRREIVR